MTLENKEGRQDGALEACNAEAAKHEASEQLNVFDKGRRGTGLNGGEYIFQPIPAGDSIVQWSGFGVDLTVYQEESEPPWSN